MSSRSKTKETIQTYTFGEKIGKGSFGEVFKCSNNVTHQTVAIKSIDLEKAEDEIDDIQQEISFLASCDSEYITKYHTSFINGTKLFIVMEYLGGGSVLDLLKPGPLEEHLCQVVVRDVLKGLVYLHDQHKIHRDIKCANILLSEQGNIKLADFGVAGQLTNTMNKRSTFVGTPFWMAPEVIKQSGYGCEADIWSLGITCIEMVDKLPPLIDLHPMKALFMITKNNPPEPKNNISKLFKAFIASCLNKEPTARPPAKDLLKHKFLKSAKQPSVLISAIERYREYIAKKRQKQFDIDTTVGAEDQVEETPQWLFDTIKTIEEYGARSSAQQLHNEKQANLPSISPLNAAPSESSVLVHSRAESIKNETKTHSRNKSETKAPDSEQSKSNSGISGIFRFFGKNKDKELSPQSDSNINSPQINKSFDNILDATKNNSILAILEQLHGKHPNCAQHFKELITLFSENSDSQILLHDNLIKLFERK